MQDDTRELYQYLTNTRITELDGNSWLQGWVVSMTLIGTVLLLDLPVLAFLNFVVGCLMLKLVHGASDNALDIQRARVASLLSLLNGMEKAADTMKGCALDPKQPEWSILQEGIQELKASAVKRRHLLNLIEQNFGCRVQTVIFKWFKKSKQDG